MRKLFLLSLLALTACATTHPSYAETVTLTWVNPTENTDNTPIPATGMDALARAEITYGTCAADNKSIVSAFVTITAPMPVTSKVTNLPGGVHCVHVLVVNNGGVKSAPSNVLVRTSPASTPKPPANFAFSGT